jgi:hypothetical protein
MKKNCITNFNEMWVNGSADQYGESAWLVRIVKRRVHLSAMYQEAMDPKVWSREGKLVIMKAKGRGKWVSLSDSILLKSNSIIRQARGANS